MTITMNLWQFFLYTLTAQLFYVFIHSWWMKRQKRKYERTLKTWYCTEKECTFSISSNADWPMVLKIGEDHEKMHRAGFTKR
jgi:hypothetical protein